MTLEIQMKTLRIKHQEELSFKILKVIEGPLDFSITNNIKKLDKVR